MREKVCQFFPTMRNYEFSYTWGRSTDKQSPEAEFTESKSPPRPLETIIHTVKEKKIIPNKWMFYGNLANFFAQNFSDFFFWNLVGEAGAPMNDNSYKL